MTSPRPQVLRTPDERCDQLPGYPYEPRYGELVASAALAHFSEDDT